MLVDHAAGGNCRGVGKNQRHADDVVVELAAVADVAALAQAFAVVGHDDNQSGLSQAQRLQLIEEFSDVVIGVSDFGVVAPNAVRHFFVQGRRLVGSAGIRLQVGKLLAQVVGLVGIEVVRPQEEGLAGAVFRPFLHPPDGQRGDILGRAIGVEELILAVEFLVIDFKAPVQARQSFLQRPGADVGGGAIVVALQNLGQRDQARVFGQRLTVDFASVFLRVASRQQANVGGAGQRDGGVGALKTDALRRQAVQPRRGEQVVAVGGEMVGPQGIDGDEQDVGPRRFRGRCLSGERQNKSHPRQE